MNLKLTLLSACIYSALLLHAQEVILSSPNGLNTVTLFKKQAGEKGNWCLQTSYKHNHSQHEVIPLIELGVSRSDQDFWDELKLISSSKPVLIREQYKALHGKRSVCSNEGWEIKVFFENPSGAKMNVIIRAYNDGIVFRYEFPEATGSFKIKKEFTSYTIPTGNRWMEKWNPANEGLYTAMDDGRISQQEWGYPALFQTKDSACYFLLHESDLTRSYCGTKLSNTIDSNTYHLAFPNPKDGRGTGESQPSISLPWKSPWRVIITGTLSTIVASTLVNDVATPSSLRETGWIKPGAVSWNYWSDNHGTKDYQVVKAFADLAVDMKWPYTLLDWEWDSMGNGGNVEDAANYILSRNIKPFIWYNSGGNHTWVSSTPKDRMLTHENRVQEFTKLKRMGFVGVKVDFFESEKQDMIAYYLDILEDAGRFDMMVYFHGCIVPRGWERTYPNLMTSEAVRGAEWHNNGPEFTTTAPAHNTMLPFTRNVVGSMDYTPVTFTNSQYPHITSFGHELALGIIVESGLQHFADRPEGYLTLPLEVKTFLSQLPTAWDDTQLIEGSPAKEVVLARRKGITWYVGGITSNARTERNIVLRPVFLEQGVKYKLTLIADGKHDKAFNVQYFTVDSKSEVNIHMLRRGGFAATLIPLH